MKEITMPHDPRSVSSKPHLDDLLAMIGVSREQLTEMTAEDLFPAATRWQQTAVSTDVAIDHVTFPGDYRSVASTGHRWVYRS
jgi:hypothetical protein